MAGYQYVLSESVRLNTISKGFSLEAVFEAVNAAVFNQAEVWWGDTIVHVLAQVSGGRRLVVSCSPDQHTNRRTIYEVREMREGEDGDFLRRTR